MKWLKRLCFKKTDAAVSPSKRRALLFAINDYMGDGNDLNGCINDQENIISKLNELFPGFDIRKFKDAEVTKKRFITELTNSIKVLSPGDTLLVHYSGHGTQVVDKHNDESDGYDEALYLFDGPIIDDDINKALKLIPKDANVVLMFDSCFSGTVTRAFKHGLIKSKDRYFPMPGVAKRHVKKARIAINEDMNWIVLSGCSENQTSADAYINGDYNGAFTWYAMRSLSKGITYKEWMDNIHKFLPSSRYDQIPTIEANDGLLNKIVFN